jgi:serine/threonine protein kinase
VLDFGLARRHRPSDGEASTHGADTDPGTVMGTAGYMSPEQVRGETADARTDIFALGSVLYEMVSGRRAFKGDTPAETMSAIVNAEPSDVSGFGHAIPPELAAVIRHCHEKRAGERFQSARHHDHRPARADRREVGPIPPSRWRSWW